MIKTWPHFDLSLRLDGIKAEESTCVDLGCGAYNSDVARQVLEYPWKSLVSVDGYLPDIEEAGMKECAAKEWEIEQGDVREWIDVGREGRVFDVVLSFDVLEHLPKEDGIKWLTGLERVATKRIVLFMPIEPEGFHRVFEDGNKLQEHLSYWRPHELISRGYRVDEVNDVHSETTPDGKRVVFGAMWAVKDL